MWFEYKLHISADLKVNIFTWFTHKASMESSMKFKINKTIFKLSAFLIPLLAASVGYLEKHYWFLKEIDQFINLLNIYIYQSSGLT